MMKKIFKSLALLLLIFNFNVSLADDHLSDKDLIKSLKQKISEFNVKPFKKKSLFQKNVEYIEILKTQLSDLEKEKEKKDKIRAATAELEREIIALGGRPLTEGQDPLETDEVILSLKKQLEEIKAIKAEEKKAKEKAAAIALEKKQIKAAKKELIKEIEALGAKPVTETDPIDENDEIMLIDDNGQLIRCPVSGIRIMGRNTQGVKIFNIGEDSSVVSVERVVEHDSEED